MAMRKKLVALMIAALMVVVLLPAVAFAAEPVQSTAVVGQDPAHCGDVPDGTPLEFSLDGTTAAFMGEVAWYEADESVGRNEAGNRVGVQIAPPEGVTPSGAVITFSTVGQKNWDEIKDGSEYVWWYPLVTEAAKTFTFTVDWDGDGEAYSVSDSYTIDCSGVTLQSLPVQVVPITLSVPSIGDLLGKAPGDLMTGVSFTSQEGDATAINVSGTLPYVEGYTGFSDNPAEQEGYYLAFTLDGDPGDYKGYKGTAAAYVPFDADMTGIIFMGQDPSVKKTITIEKQDGTVYTLDTSGLTLEEKSIPDNGIVSNARVNFIGAENWKQALGVAESDSAPNDLPWIQVAYTIELEKLSGTSVDYEITIEKGEVHKTFADTIDLSALIEEGKTTATGFLQAGLGQGGNPNHNDYMGLDEVDFEGGYTVTVKVGDQDSATVLPPVTANYEAYRLLGEIIGYEIVRVDENGDAENPTLPWLKINYTRPHAIDEMTVAFSPNGSGTAAEYTLKAAEGYPAGAGSVMVELGGDAPELTAGEYDITISAEKTLNGVTLKDEIQSAELVTILDEMRAEGSLQPEATTDPEAPKIVIDRENGLATGIPAGSDEDSAPKAGEIASLFSVPAGASIVVTDAAGNPLDDADTAGTGCRIRLVAEGGIVYDEVECVVLGDVIGSGVVGSGSCVVIADDVLNNIENPGTTDFAGAFLAAADVNGDGKIDSSDAVALADMILDRIGA